MIKTLAFAAATAIGLLAASAASASTTFTIGTTKLTVYGDGNSVASARTGETAFWGGASTGITESFETLAPNVYTPVHSLVTAAGTFTQTLTGFGGLCGTNCDKGVAVLNNTINKAMNGGPEYSGRFATNGNNWLDSNDSRVVTWSSSPLDPAGYLGFFLTDANDTYGRMRIETLNGNAVEVVFNDILGAAQGNKRVYYIAIEDKSGLASIDFLSGGKINGVDNVPQDGWGIDEFRVLEVPEPGVMALLGFGLLGAGMMSRRRKTA